MKRRRLLRTGRLALVMSVVIVGLSGAAHPASGSGGTNRTVIDNPGRFVVTHGPGSYTALLDRAGDEAPIGYLDIGNPPCDNGIDDDVDGLLDSDDPQCVGAEDSNERLPGLQPYISTTLPIKVKANGVITMRPADFFVQQREKCIQASDGVWCLGITIRGAGVSQRGSMTEGRISLKVPVTVKFDALVGYTGLDPRCKIGYIGHTFVSDDYDEDTGTAIFTGSVERAPAMSNCGQWTELFNGALSLPGTSRVVVHTTTVNAEGEPPQFAD